MLTPILLLLASIAVLTAFIYLCFHYDNRPTTHHGATTTSHLPAPTHVLTTEKTGARPIIPPATPRFNVRRIVNGTGAEAFVILTDYRDGQYQSSIDDSDIHSLIEFFAISEASRPELKQIIESITYISDLDNNSTPGITGFIFQGETATFLTFKDAFDIAVALSEKYNHTHWRFEE